MKERGTERKTNTVCMSERDKDIKGETEKERERMIETASDRV